MSVVKTSTGIEVTFTVTNTGSGALSAVSAVFAAFPAGVTYLSSTPSVGSYDAPTRTWTVGTMNAAAEETITLVFALTDASALPLNIVGTVSTTTTESKKSNNTVTKVIDRSVLASGIITKVVTQNYTVQPGVDNYIIVDAGGGNVTVTLPASANFDNGAGGYYPVAIQVMDDAAGVSVITIDGDAGDTLLNDDGAGTAADTGITLVEGDFRVITPETGTPTNIYVLGQFV